MSERPWIVYAPPFDHRCGGVRALYRLRDELAARGIDVYLGRGVPGAPCRDCARPRGPTDDELARSDRAEAVVVLSEILTARGDPPNPTASPYVVRWWLNRWDDDVRRPLEPHRVDQLSFVFSRQIDEHLPRLHVPHIDTETFQPAEGRRHGSAVYLGKSRQAQPLDAGTPKPVIDITRMSPPTAGELADLLRRVEVLVSFDPLSALNLEATLCGTPVLMHPDGRWTREEIERGELGAPPGYCWPGHDLDEARAAAAGAHEAYLARLPRFDRDVDRLIRLVRQRFTGLRLPPIRSPVGWPRPPRRRHDPFARATRPIRKPPPPRRITPQR